MMIDPHRCIGRDIHFHIGNFAVVCSFKKRRRGDRLAHTVIGAAYLVAAVGLACKLFVTWIPRRSNVASVIADDLTHINFTSALETYPYCSTTKHNAFPPPVSDWMRNPVHDRNLGHNILLWMMQT